MKNTQPKFIIEDNKTTCILFNNGKKIIGEAYCHPEDADMKNKNTGCEIALRRATIKAYKTYKEELTIRLRTLNQLYYSINKSKHFNSKSYENKMLQHQIYLIKTDLDMIKELISIEKEKLNEYIILKEKFYQTIRANRAKKNNNDNTK